MAGNEPKQVLIWRSDVRNTQGQKVRTGKIAAQMAAVHIYTGQSAIYT